MRGGRFDAGSAGGDIPGVPEGNDGNSGGGIMQNYYATGDPEFLSRVVL